MCVGLKRAFRKIEAAETAFDEELGVSMRAETTTGKSGGSATRSAKERVARARQLE